MGRERISITHPLSGPFLFMQEAVAASQSAVALMIAQLADPSSGTCDTGCTEFTMPFPGSVVAISVRASGARTAGTLTVDATLDGTVTGLQAVLDAVNTQGHSGTQATLQDRFAENQRLGVKITTDASWAPVTADIVVGVWVEFEDVDL